MYAQYLIEWSSVVDVSDLTRRRYLRWVGFFLSFLAGRPATAAALSAWRVDLLSRCQPSTVRAYLVAVRLFFGWLHRRHGFDDISAESKSVRLTQGHKRGFLTESQARALINLPNHTQADLRDSVMIALMLVGGLRTIEISRANVEDISKVGACRVLFLQGKGRQDRDEYIKLPNVVCNLLDRYVTTLDTAALFPSLSNNHKGQRLTTRAIRAIVKRRLLAVGIDDPRITAHSLRHTAATLALLHGADVRAVQQMLRHKSVNTTLIYAHDIERLQNDTEDTLALLYYR